MCIFNCHELIICLFCVNYNLTGKMCCACTQIREKRAKKKERKMAAETEGGNGCDERESIIIPDTPSEALKEESENMDKQAMTMKRPQKSSQFTKQSKTKSIPPPLRSRSKRRMQPWMWVLLTTLIVLALFFVGQSGFSTRSSWFGRGFGFEI